MKTISTSAKIVNALSLCSLLIVSTSTSAEEDQLLIEKATRATVLIKTHLKHGFIEDEEANDRWSGSGFLVDRITVG